MLELGFEIIDLERVKNNGYNLVGTFYQELKNKCQFVTLRDISIVESGNSAPQNSNSFKNGIHPFFRVSDVAKTHISSNLLETADKLNNEGVKGLRWFKKGSILFPKSGASSILNHRAIMGRDGYVSSHLAVISAFLFYLLVGLNAKNITLNDNYPSIRIDSLQNLQIPLPPLLIHEEIVAELEHERNMIEPNKETINLFEEKLKTKLDSLLQWFMMADCLLLPLNPKIQKECLSNYVELV